MADNYGKKFEAIFKQDFLRLADSTIDRLYDPGFGMRGISNISDFIGYVYPNIWYLECKTIKGNTFPLKNLTQYDKLLAKKDIKGVRAGAIIWFRDHDKVIFVPIKTFEQCYNEGLKSINVKMIGDKNYFIIDIPSKKKRTFLTRDYSVLLNINEDLFNGKQ